MEFNSGFKGLILTLLLNIEVESFVLYIMLHQIWPAWLCRIFS